ncbi:MAG: hypothetical protein QG657_4586 [Acidobacteriota bacterium]|nr:hypothetical protein [Acidobacteriota bacterium]
MIDDYFETPEPELYDILLDIQEFINLEQKKGKDAAKMEGNRQKCR